MFKCQLFSFFFFLAQFSTLGLSSRWEYPVVRYSDRLLKILKRYWTSLNHLRFKTVFFSFENDLQHWFVVDATEIQSLRISACSMMFCYCLFSQKKNYFSFQYFSLKYKSISIEKDWCRFYSMYRLQLFMLFGVTFTKFEYYQISFHQIDQWIEFIVRY